MTEVLVRPMRPDDVPAANAGSFATFVELDTRLGQPVPDFTDAVRTRGEARMRHLLATDPDGAWVAEHDGQVAGVVMATRRGGQWFLSLLTVSPQLQAQGVGRRLLDAALQTYEGARGGFVLSSPDPRALRRYALAGFLPQPGYDCSGVVDRSALPGDLRVRAGDLSADGALVDSLVAELRGEPHGPDLQALAGLGVQVLVDADDQGFALVTPQRVVNLGARTPQTAQRLLWAALAESSGECEVMFVGADQLWAVPVLLAARVALRPGTSSCRRGTLGPMTPYLPTGAYG